MLKLVTSNPAVSTLLGADLAPAPAEPARPALRAVQADPALQPVAPAALPALPSATDSLKAEYVRLRSVVCHAARISPEAFRARLDRELAARGPDRSASAWLVAAERTPFFCGHCRGDGAACATCGGRGWVSGEKLGG